MTLLSQTAHGMRLDNQVLAESRESHMSRLEDDIALMASYASVWGDDAAFIAGSTRMIIENGILVGGEKNVVAKTLYMDSK